MMVSVLATFKGFPKRIAADWVLRRATRHMNSSGHLFLNFRCLAAVTHSPFRVLSCRLLKPSTPGTCGLWLSDKLPVLLDFMDQLVLSLCESTDSPVLMFHPLPERQTWDRMLRKLNQLSTHKERHHTFYH